MTVYTITLLAASAAGALLLLIPPTWISLRAMQEADDEGEECIHVRRCSCCHEFTDVNSVAACPHCGGEKCPSCDLGDSVPCMRCVFADITETTGEVK